MTKEVIQRMLDAFGKLFLLSQRFEYIANKDLDKDDLTTKQFLLIAAIEKGFDHPPSLSEAADILSTSRQNVKQLVNILEKKGFIKVVSSEEDKRKSLLTLTKKNREYWDSRADAQLKTIAKLFRTLAPTEISEFYSIVDKLLDDSSKIYEDLRDSL
jgi:DNA-binding MarR family transcriptional regulator